MDFAQRCDDVTEFLVSIKHFTKINPFLFVLLTSHEGLNRSLQSSSQKLSRGHSFI